SDRRRGKAAEIGLRHVISITHALLGCMGRDHGVAGSIEQDALQGSVVLGPRRDVMGSLLGQSPLHGLKQLAVDQWRLRARADLTFIENLTDVEAIAQEVEQGALREGHATARAAVRQLADLCSPIAPRKVGQQPVDAAEREIPTKDHADPLGLLFDDGELAILEFVSQRHHSADPQALALGSRYLVANALRGDLSLKLRKRE